MNNSWIEDLNTLQVKYFKYFNLFDINFKYLDNYIKLADEDKFLDKI